MRLSWIFFVARGKTTATFTFVLCVLFMGYSWTWDRKRILCARFFLNFLNDWLLLVPVELYSHDMCIVEFLGVAFCICFFSSFFRAFALCS